MLALLAQPAIAGPPFVSDDPEPTPYHQFEIYTFNNGTNTRDGTGGEAGLDFNYGAAPDLQLTATLPAGFNQSVAGGTNFGLSNIEIAAKYRFLHQDTFGLDVAVFPRVFLSSGVTSCLRRWWLRRSETQKGACLNGRWTIEIVKRSDAAKGFKLLPRRWVVERTIAWLNRNRRLAKDFEATIASAEAWLMIASVKLLCANSPEPDPPRIRLSVRLLEI